MSRPQNFVWSLPQPQNSPLGPQQKPLGPQKKPLGPQKFKNDLKIKSKSNVRIERNKENKSCSTTRVDLETDFEPYTDTKKAH